MVKTGPILTGVRTELKRLFPKSPTFALDVQEKLLDIKTQPIISLGLPLLVGIGLAIVPEPVSTVDRLG